MTPPTNPLEMREILLNKLWLTLLNSEKNLPPSNSTIFYTNKPKLLSNSTLPLIFSPSLISEEKPLKNGTKKITTLKNQKLLLIDNLLTYTPSNPTLLMLTMMEVYLLED